MKKRKKKKKKKKITETTTSTTDKPKQNKRVHLRTEEPLIEQIYIFALQYFESLLSFP